jgi:predicted dithiol-disulfide oxidoreductase (DUF899 family)
MSTSHPVCTREQWSAARKELLAQEKHFTRLRDQLTEARRALPWVRVEQNYVFQGAEGARALRDLFGDKSQLLVYHLMFAPEWDAACTSCSFWADQFDATLVHLAHRDVSFAAISRAPVPKLSAYARRMGWHFPWFSSEGNTFNYDYAVSFSEQQRNEKLPVYNFGTQAVSKSDMPGFSVFYRDDKGDLFHTYSCYSRGIDMANAAYQLLDLVPKGRDEGDAIMGWLRRHDEYQG